MARKLVRVQAKDTGHKYTILADPKNLSDAYELLRGEDAVDAGGQPLPPEPNVDVGSKTPRQGADSNYTTTPTAADAAAGTQA